MILLKVIFIVSVLQVATSQYRSRGYHYGRRGNRNNNDYIDVGRIRKEFRNGIGTDGLCLSSCITSNAFNQTLTTNNLILRAENIINALTEAPEGLGQEVAVYLIIALVGELSDSVSLDGCDFVNLINALVEYTRSGHSRNLKNYLYRFVKRFEEYIDDVVSISNGDTKDVVTERTTIKGTCGYGRQYSFDEAWNLLENMVYYDYTVGYVTELRAVARELATSSSFFLNTLGTAVTAAAPVAYLGLFTNALEPLVDFLYAVASCGGDPADLAQTAKAEINRNFLRIYSQL